MKTTEDEKQKFIKMFEEEFDDKVVSFELAELRASPVVFNILKLVPEQETDFLWGLVVFCESDIYFYSFPQENIISFYVRKSSGAADPVFQCISLSDWKCRYRLPEKHFLDFLIPKRKNIVKTYFFDEDKISLSFELCLNKKAADVINLFPAD